MNVPMPSIALQDITLYGTGQHRQDISDWKSAVSCKRELFSGSDL